MGVLGQSPLPEKEPHDLETARWRLRLLVGASQRLRANTQDTSHDGRIGTVAATGKRAARFGGSAMATAPFGRSKSAASCQYSGHITRWAYWDSRRYRKKSRTIWRRRDGDCAFWSGQVSGFVPILRTLHTMGVAGQSPLPEKEPHDFEDTGRKRA